MSVFDRKYGVSDSVSFSLFAPDGVDFLDAATFAAGDVTISIDGGAYASTTNLPTPVTGGGYSLVLTLSELTGKKIKVRVVDLTATKVWLDRDIDIETYGNASAQHPFDRSATYVAPDNASTALILTGMDIVRAGVIESGVAGSFHIQMFDTDNLPLAAGVAVTVERRIDGGAFAAATGTASVTDAKGVTLVSYDALDVTGTGAVAFALSGTGARGEIIPFKLSV